MAEAAKMLNPDKNVYLANPSAGCPMAEQMEPGDDRNDKGAGKPTER